MENKKIKNATPLVYESIKFKSKLEVTIYKTLKEAGLSPQYEEDTFVLLNGFKPSVPYYGKDKRTKDLSLKDKKIIRWAYTPDFTVKVGDWTFYIEAKGMENDVYRYKRKMFLKLLESLPNSSFIEVYTKRHIITAIEIMKSYGKNKETDKISAS